MSLPRTRKVAFGGDYNLEQWPEEVWAEVLRFDAYGVVLLREDS